MASKHRHALMRRTALTALNRDAIDADRLALIKSILCEQTGALLGSMSAARAGG